MMNHEFTNREKLLLLVFTIMLLGTFYYKVAYIDFKHQMELYDVDSIQEEMDLEQAKAMHLAKMKTAIAQNKDQYKGEILKYNNQANEINAINLALNTSAKNVSISWNEPELEGSIVRRNANISFTTNNYENFKRILKNLSEGPYRCIVSTVSMDASDEDVHASMQVTYYETVEGVKDLSGLRIQRD